MKDIVLIGGGGHCRSAIDVIEKGGQFQIAGVIDKPELLGSKILDYSVIGSDVDMSGLASKYKYALITVGQIKSPALRIELFGKAVEAGFIFPKIISPNAYVSEHAIIGHGTIVMHDALVNAGTSIESNCIINSKALIEHDCKILSHSHISTGAIVNGGVLIEHGSFIGSGAVIRNGAIVHKYGFVKAGSLVY